MIVKLFDSYSEQLKPLVNKKINIYNCGPTVYNHIHIGNARPLIVFDVLYRLLKYLNKDVTYVLNITDIDDKIIAAAKKEGISELELSEKYFQEYLKIKKALNTLEMVNPKVSDHIDEIVSFIDELINKGSAYIVDGDVYFDTTAVANYGKLSKRNLDELLEGARVEVDKKKKHPNDFVLWKKTNDGINWETKWSKGRPGWHTECVVLINKLIGDCATIHGGGMDLKFPHHENENAQNCALHHHNLADIWLHIGMININNQKMSKSLNNFILVKDILEKVSYSTLRWFFYQANIANPLNYSNEHIELIEKEISKINRSINLAKTSFYLNDIDFNVNTNHHQIDNEQIDALCDNLNFPNAVTTIYRLTKELNSQVKDKMFTHALRTYWLLINGLDLLGINFINLHDQQTLNELKTWQNLSLQKNYTEADKIRTILINKRVM